MDLLLFGAVVAHGIVTYCDGAHGGGPRPHGRSATASAAVSAAAGYVAGAAAR